MVLRRFPPALYDLYPRCPVRALLHVDCPGCGGTRALAALLHGDVAEALHFNRLIVVLVPFVAAYALACAWRAWTADEFRWPEETYRRRRSISGGLAT